MANQYSGNFELVIKEKFDCSVKEILEVCCSKGLSYYEAEKLLGFKHVTIRKWARRFGIKLVPKLRQKEFERKKDLIKNFGESDINKYNVFSRCWML